MSKITQRIQNGAELGMAKRWVDVALGCAALAPILIVGAAVWILPQAGGVALALLAVMWSGALLTFFAGVRRGLTFSERGGARPSELASMLWLFCMGVLTLILESPLVGAVGFASLAILDMAAARRQEAPVYFKQFRPAQMAVAVAGLLLILAREI
ncbi:MAG: hypothetical protein ACYDD1_03055 [Caulobacteraceae bacterium]